MQNLKRQYSVPTLTAGNIILLSQTINQVYGHLFGLGE